MAPQTYSKLLRAAKTDGCSSLGDWLHKLPLAATSTVAELPEDTPFAVLCSEFRRYAAQARDALTELHELVDLDPQVAKDPEDVKVLAELEHTYASLMSFLRRV
jgi:hypothetical protein